MTITIKATFKNGVLKPRKPLPLVESTVVRVTISPEEKSDDPLEGLIGIGSSGRTDGADNHDHYIYGTRRRR
jgi:predicted DNA-binding antitoxin AbrB/MazE fold protein